MTALPVDSFREAAPLLRRPFEPAAVRWKVQASFGASGLIVGYIDARLASERLNLVCPHLWHDHYTPASDGLLVCELTVDGITRRDVGQGKGKGLYSDAFKRAAVKFGVAVSLYALPQIWLNADDGHLKLVGQAKDKLALTPAGVEHLRSSYTIWLGTSQGASFGEPLSHGDAAEGSIGDPLDPDAGQDEFDPGAAKELPDAPPAKPAAKREAPKITVGQRKLIEIRAKQAGMTDAMLGEAVAAVAGTPSVADLAAADFRKVLEDLEARTPVEESVAP